MDHPRSCCKPCDVRGFCSTETNCCVECHMSWEEMQCGPYLPPQTLALLKHQHMVLLSRGLPVQELAAHSQWEEGVFREYCPPELLAQVRTDHDAWEHGRLRSRRSR